MPGLVLVIAKDAAHPYARSVASTMESLHHEAFYVEDVVAAPELGVFAGCVAHAGSFAQRVSAYRHPDGALVYFTGECFTETGQGRAAPQSDPAAFAADLIESVRTRGEQHLRHLNGMFSGLIVDRARGCCVRFNDRFGMERLYWHQTDGAILVASEAKAILRIAESTRYFDRQGVAQYLKFGSVQGPQTLFRNIHLLPGASVVRFEAGGVTSRNRYFTPTEWEGQDPLTAEEFTDRLTATVKRVVPDYLQGDQRIAFSITGGLDTRMILAALPPGSTDIDCYTFGGLSGETLDQGIGRQVAESCDLRHESLMLSRSWLESFPDQLDRTVWLTDGTAGATTAHEVFLTGQGRRLGEVRLTGNFGSEVLRGMSTLKPWSPSPGLLAPEFVSEFESCERLECSAHPVTRASFDEIPCHLFGSLAAGRSQVVFRTPYLDNSIVQLAYAAPESARLSPAPSLEVVRRLRPMLASIPTDRGAITGSGQTGATARRAWETLRFKLDYLDKEGLSGELRWLDTPLRWLGSTPLLGKHKYLPYRRWFQRELRAWLTREIAGADALGQYFESRALGRLSEEHATGRHNRLREIGAAVTLSAINRQLLSAPRYRQ